LAWKVRVGGKKKKKKGVDLRKGGKEVQKGSQTGKKKKKNRVDGWPRLIKTGVRVERKSSKREKPQSVG